MRRSQSLAALGFLVACTPATTPVGIVGAGVSGTMSSIRDFDQGRPSRDEPPMPERTPDDRRWANELSWTQTRAAMSAARAERCDDVEALGLRVKLLADDFFHDVFVRDVAIARCLDHARAQRQAEAEALRPEPRAVVERAACDWVRGQLEQRARQLADDDARDHVLALRPRCGGG